MFIQYGVFLFELLLVVLTQILLKYWYFVQCLGINFILLPGNIFGLLTLNGNFVSRTLSDKKVTRKPLFEYILSGTISTFLIAILSGGIESLAFYQNYILTFPLMAAILLTSNCINYYNEGQIIFRFLKPTLECSASALADLLGVSWIQMPTVPAVTGSIFIFMNMVLLGIVIYYVEFEIFYSLNLIQGLFTGVGLLQTRIIYNSTNPYIEPITMTLANQQNVVCTSYFTKGNRAEKLLDIYKYLSSSVMFTILFIGYFNPIKFGILLTMNLTGLFLLSQFALRFTCRDIAIPGTNAIADLLSSFTATIL